MRQLKTSETIIVIQKNLYLCIICVIASLLLKSSIEQAY